MPISKRDDNAIFNAARQIGDRQARRDYLCQACRGDTAQLDRITVLLRKDEDESQFVELPAVDLPLSDATPPIGGTFSSDATSPINAASPTNELPGTVIGPYTIRELLGEGGMGVVYVAEQTEPVRRNVALKIIKPGMDSAEVLARFDAERQALAMMSHPNIAKILDGGRTESGRPYFVMELVKGVPITEFCDTQKLDLRARLDLFVTVCQAVQHAHRKGIIHRDLKPSNVLVELRDDASMPKVIDFGVAKAINSQLTQQTIYTHFSQLIGTPLYMSPEQAQLSGLDVDTRSDVYSLGVMLYELLAGVPPFDRKTLSNVGLDEWRRIIREDEPQRPSDKVSTLNNETISTISSQRKSSPRDLSLSMRRELDWIVMKTLEKDRDRRYESASDLAADIQRFLNDEPVEAHPPSPSYRLRKFARKNRTGIITTSIVAVALIIGTSVSTWLAHEANQARKLADQRFIDADEQRRKAVRAAELARRNEEVSRQLVYAADVNLAAQAREAGDVRRFTRILDRHVPNAGQVDRRGFEWWFLRQFAQAGFHDIAIETGGSSVARFSPDGKYLVTGRYDETVCFWDGESEKLLAVKRGHKKLTRGIDFAPDGIHMASIGDDGIIRIWDLATQKQIRSFQAHNNHGFRVFYVNDGQTLASCGEDTSVMLWNSANGDALGELKNYARTVERSAMNRSVDGRYCVSGNPQGFAYVWDTKTNQRLCELNLGSRDGIRCLASCASFSPDGRFVAVGTDENLIRICDAHTGAQIETLIGHEDDLQDVTFHPSGRLLASSDRAGVIRVWPLHTDGKLLKQMPDANGVWPLAFQAHSARIWALDFSPDGSRLVSASKDGKVRSWSGRAPAQTPITDTGRETVAMTFSASGNRVFLAEEKRIRVWNRQTKEIQAFEKRFEQSAYCVAISPDDQTCVTGHAKGWIRLWSCKTGELIRAIQGHTDSVDEIAFSPDGRMLVTGSWDGRAIVWDPSLGQQLATFEMQPHCYSVAFSPDSRLLACSSEDNAMIYDIASGELQHLLKGHQSSARCLAFSPDGRWLATGSADRTVRIWNVETGRSKHVIAANKDEINSIAFSPDGTTIASGGKRGTIAFSHVSTGRFLMDTKAGSDRVNWLEFSPDGTCLAAAVDEQDIQLLYAPRTPPTTESVTEIADQ